MRTKRSKTKKGSWKIRLQSENYIMICAGDLRKGRKRPPKLSPMGGERGNIG